MPVKVAINGFGRIGRAFFRRAIRQDRFAVAAVNDLAPLDVLAHLLKYDSVHGRYPGEVAAADDALIVDGRRIPVTRRAEPDRLPWRELGIWAVLDSTGAMGAYDRVAGHLAAGARRVVLSCNPDRADRARIKTLVVGVNQDAYDPATDRIVSNASCTTNCLAPVVAALDARFGVVEGFVTTIHAYTHDQRLVDAPHADLARARAAALNLVPTTTGATEALGVVLPGLAGRFTGLSVRVPTANVSLADLNVTLAADVTAREINDAMQALADGPLRGIVDVTWEPLVSGDLNGSPASATLAARHTMVASGNGAGGRLAKLLLWYDNETGYAARLVDILSIMTEREKEPDHGD